MSFQIILTVRRHPEHGVFLMAQTLRPATMNGRMEDEIRHAVLDQATRQAKEMIDKEMIGGDSTASAEPTDDFKFAVRRLDEFGMLEPDTADLDLSGDLDLEEEDTDA